MKKNYSFIIGGLLILTSISCITTSTVKNKHQDQKPTEILLSKMKEFIGKKRIAKITKLEKSKKLEKRTQAEILKKRNRLDHIRIIGNNGAMYLQLENSVLPIFLEPHTYYLSPIELEKQLNGLSQTGLVIDKNTKIVIYPSRKSRMNFLFKSWYTHKDLYSASIKVNFDIKNPLPYTIRRTNLDCNKKLMFINTGNSL